MTLNHGDHTHVGRQRNTEDFLYSDKHVEEDNVFCTMLRHSIVPKETGLIGQKMFSPNVVRLETQQKGMLQSICS